MLNIMRIPVAKEGSIFLIVSVLLAAVSFFFAWYVVGVLLLTLFVFFVFFFRVPERTIIDDKDLVFSAADGKIVQIKRVEENEFLKTPATRISVFMSVFNVHVNLAPVSGRVAYLKHHQGKYLNALNEKASEVNEACHIGIESDSCRVAVKQIAGLVARRIVNRIKPGDELSTGTKLGIIMFGSRVDIFLDDNFRVTVKEGQTARAGITVIGEKIR